MSNPDLTAKLETARLNSNATRAALRCAHAQAIASGERFAEIVLLDLIGEAAALHQKIARALDATKEAAP